MLVDFGTATLNDVKACVEATGEAHVELRGNEDGFFKQGSTASVSTINRTEFWTRCRRPIGVCIAICLDASLFPAVDDYAVVQHSLSTALSSAEVSRL